MIPSLVLLLEEALSALTELAVAMFACIVLDKFTMQEAGKGLVNLVACFHNLVW